MSAMPELPKQMTDIERPLPLEEDWYLMKVVKQPVVQPNKKKRDGLAYDEGAGQNLVLRLRVVSDDKTINGRAFTKWVPWPVNGDGDPLGPDDGDGDADHYDEYSGMLIVDRKMQDLGRIAAALKGVDEGEASPLDIAVGDQAYFYVVQQPSFRNPEEMEATIDINQFPKMA